MLAVVSGPPETGVGQDQKESENMHPLMSSPLKYIRFHSKNPHDMLY